MSGQKISQLRTTTTGASHLPAHDDVVPALKGTTDEAFSLDEIYNLFATLHGGLTAGSSLAGTDIVPGMQSTNGRKFTLAQLAAFVLTNRTTSFSLMVTNTGLNSGSGGVTLLYENLVKTANRVGFPYTTAGYTQVRLMGRCVTAGTSGTKVRLRYTTSFDTTAGNAIQMGASSTEVQVAVDATGALDSGWVTLVAGAIADPIYLCPQQGGGDGTSSNPVLQALYVLFR